MSSDQFIFHKAWADALTSSPDDIRLKVIDAIIQYATTGETPQLTQETSMAFQFAKQQIDADQKKWENTREKRRAAGRMGGIARQANASIAKQNKQMLAMPSKSSNAKQIKQCQANQANQAIYNIYTTTTNSNIEEVEDIEANASNAKQNKQMLENTEEQTREQKLYDELEQSPMRMESLARLTKLKQDEIKEKLLQFKVWATASGATSHANLKDLQNHFAKWLTARIKAEQPQQPSTILTDDNQDKYKTTERW